MVCIGSELNSLVEVVNEHIVQFVFRDHGDQGDNQDANADQQWFVVPDDEIRKPVHRTFSRAGLLCHLYRQHGHERWQKEYR